MFHSSVKVQERKKKPWQKRLIQYISESYQLYSLLLPGAVFIFIFAYVPMYGAQIATLNKEMKPFDELHVSLPKEESDKMLLFADFDQFSERIRGAVMQVCHSVRRTKELRDTASRNAIVHYVNQNYLDANMSLVQVADVFGMSIYTLRRIFKDATGLRFKEYVVGKRMKHAHDLLITTSKSIKEISAIVGCSTPDYFGKMFKGYYGCSPSDMRIGYANEKKIRSVDPESSIL